MKLNINSIFIALAVFISSPAQAGISLLTLASLNGTLPDNVAVEAVKTYGIFFAHRPYDGATSMFDTNALDLKFEVTLMKVGDGLFKALEANGLGSTASSSTTALPIARVHIRKPLSKTMDVGVSGIFYSGQYAIGTDLKIELNEQEEGINTAIRIGYSYATATTLYLKSVSVISPEFVMSRKIQAAEPYLGVGVRFMSGTISVPVVPTITITKTGTGYTTYAYTGVMFQLLGPKGFRFGMEGHYDISGFSSIGTMFGIGF